MKRAHKIIPTANDGEIDAEEKQAIEESLFLYFSGQEHLVSDALTNTKGISVGTYYKRRKEFPDQVLRICKKARDRAREFIAGQRQALDAEAIAFSKELQATAREYLEAGMESLGAIARGEVRVYELDEKDRDGSPRLKKVIVYPRDITAAMKILSEIARGGVLPEGKISLPLVSAQTEEVEQTPHIPVLGISTDFRRVTATAVDGTEYTAEVKRGDVIDVEVEE